MTKDIEREAFEEWYENHKPVLLVENIVKGTARAAWQAAKAHEAEKLKGKVVVPNNQIEVWWQDAEEPENFATTIESMPALGENLGDKEIMEIDEHHTIHLPSKRIYGTWFEKDGEKCFATGTLEECRAMLEAARGGK